MYNLNDIKYETVNFWVLKIKDGYEIYREGITHSTRCCQVGGLDRLSIAIYWCDKYQRNYK